MATVVAVVAFVAVAHTPLGRPVLGWLRGAPGCPIGGELDPATAAAVRADLTGPLRGDADAPSNTVLGGLDIGEASREDVQRWAAEHDLRCTPTTQRCTGTLLGIEGTVVLHFDETRLLDVEVSARSPDAARALAIADVLDGAVGHGARPWRAQGAMSPDALAAAPLRQSRREYRFTQRRAEVRATNLGPRGYLVRGFAQSMPDAEPGGDSIR